jgi:hypothetical protein
MSTSAEKTFTLSADHLGQLIDCVEVRLEQWRSTARYFEDPESMELRDFVEEGSSEREANGMVVIYEDLLAELVKARGG